MTGKPKVLHATAWYPPYSLGGTEVYVASLVEELGRSGIVSGVIVPRHADAPDHYEHEGVMVQTYPVNDVPAPEELRRQSPHLGFERFRALIAAEPDAIYHQHSWTRGCGLHHLQCAHDLGLRTIVTVHVPSSICFRGTMMRYGERPCDGLVEATKCGSCYLEGRGLSKVVAKTVAGLPLAVSERARRGSSRAATALSARALGAGKRDQLVAMISNADIVVAVCQWLHDALVANGTPLEKLRLSRQGLSRAYVEAALHEGSRVCSEALRILFLGRWDQVKGVDVLVGALRALPPDIEVQLTVHAIAASSDERDYEARVRAMAGDDARIVFAGPLDRNALATTMDRHDVLAVPSTCLETGPLVVLEAQAAGLFVLGSRLGGIAELIDESRAGELIEPGNVEAWSAAMRRLEHRWRSGELVRAPQMIRTMDVVSSEMADLYRHLEQRES